MLFFSNASLLNVTNSACTTRGHERGCRLPQRPRPRPALLGSLFSLTFAPSHTHTHMWQRVWSETGRRPAGALGLDTRWTKPREGHEIHSLTHWLERWIIHLRGRENLIFTLLSLKSAPYLQVSTDWKQRKWRCQSCVCSASALSDLNEPSVL